MSEQYLGEIRLVGFTFAPVGWALCNGQTLSISQNQALFALLGTTYGGNGVTTFQLPNLQGRFAMHFGTGYTQGTSAGSASVTLNTSNLPSHSHTVSPAASTANATSTSPSGHVPAVVNDGTRQQNPYPAYAASGSATLAATATSLVGSSTPVSILPPYLVLNYIIALEGIFPSRN